jgi:flagellar capping protein FliD
MLVTEFNNIGTEITSDNSEISDDQTRVNTIQADLQQQLSAADAAIAVLQQQSTFYTNLFQTENANDIAGL